MGGSSMTFTRVLPSEGVLTVYGSETKLPGIERVGTSPPIAKIVIEWMSDDTDGSVTAVSGYGIGWIERVVTIPGTPAPNAGYDVTFKDEYGVDLLAQSDANMLGRSASLPEQIMPFLMSSGGPPAIVGVYPVTHGPITVNVENAGNAKQGKIIIWARTQ